MDSSEKLLERMRQSKTGWRYNDLDTLYRGFGFQVRDKGKHTIYFHAKYKHLWATVTRHRTLAIGYITNAIKLIEEVKRLSKEENNESHY